MMKIKLPCFLACCLLQILLLLSASPASAQTAEKLPDAEPPFLQYLHSPWVDSVFKTLSPRERVAQLFMAAAYTNKDKAYEDSVSHLISKWGIGGLVFFQGGPVRQAKLLNQYQAQAEVPLLIAMDLEWGMGMRLDSTISYPYQMALGALQHDSLIYQMGREIALQSKRIGVQVNFAPVVDINNNPANPVISFRSFGENKDKVTAKAYHYMKGMQDQQVLPTAKHFPGHGDTGTDSHYNLPLIAHTRQRLDSLELYPFRELINKGIGGVMIAHLSIPTLDPTKDLPSTLSKPIVTGLLKEELGFKGLVVSDAMNMKGVTKFFPAGDADVRALIAGNDVLEFSENIPLAIEEVMKAIRKGSISQAEIDRKCRKMLAVKQWVGLDKYTPTAIEGVIKDLNSPEANLLNRQLVEGSLTTLVNNGELLPLKRLDTLKIASVSVGAEGVSNFQQMLGKYTKVEHIFVPEKATAKDLAAIQERLSQYNLVLLGLHETGTRPYNTMRYPAELLQFISNTIKNNKVVLTLFRNPYLLAKIPSVEQAEALLLTYYDHPLTQELAAQAIFGGIGTSGLLPVTVSESFKEGSGLVLEGGIRFKYTIPEEVGIRSDKLLEIDSLVLHAIRERATPGAQVLVAKDQKIIYQKSFGHHTYDSIRPVDLKDVYDLASITKITGPLPALMKLYDEDKFHLDKTMPDYIKSFRRSTIEDVPFREILAHQGRLMPYIVYWKNTVKKNGKFKWFTFKSDSSKRFPIRVADNLYLNRNYHKKIEKAIRKAPLNEEEGYKYSGLSFLLYPQIIQDLTGQSYEDYLQKHFYNPLGATTVNFNAYKHLPPNRIVPTEYDSLFRKSQAHGMVHDEAAAMLGGVSGNAGLFANANDLAKIMQMYLNGGTYGDRRYIKEETMKEWSRVQFPEKGNRRGLGFDKPELVYEVGATAKSASKESFGHSGFTGTFTWVDPENGLLYVFLSNRVYPTRDNPKLSQFNTRTNVLQVLYDALEEQENPLGENKD